ncbi:LPP20 family lipoprotein [Psychrobium sp. MM17-31]|uniref:LPP20 family lipoprotein n=1 Tax=Psychrobium sp. MM17-31 TaxID=2917758 RepID=UPI001EF3DF96|nr:LPP20 family lipoprotein [Psychrobium sp. MM17-31]MCG7530140.1 LPP20 family lipoprotein [Psychrobium sp. MM17-31]
MLRLLTAIVTTVLLWGCTSSSQVKYYQEAPKEFAKFYATGYAPINSQMGENKTERILQAIKASKLEAYRELTAQVHGHQIDGQTQLSELMVANSSLNASVQGLIRGAKVIKSYPVSDEIYATELELDYKNLYLLYNSTAMPRRIINE